MWCCQDIEEVFIGHMVCNDVKKIRVLNKEVYYEILLNDCGELVDATSHVEIVI